MCVCISTFCRRQLSSPVIIKNLKIQHYYNVPTHNSKQKHPNLKFYAHYYESASN
jgi:hypothetical protein